MLITEGAYAVPPLVTGDVPTAEKNHEETIYFFLPLLRNLRYTIRQRYFLKYTGETMINQVIQIDWLLMLGLNTICYRIYLFMQLLAKVSAREILGDLISESIPGFYWNFKLLNKNPLKFTGVNMRPLKNFFTMILFLTSLSHYEYAYSEVETDNLDIFEKLQNTIIRVSEDIKPTVVHIEATLRSQQKRIKSIGSGIISDENGYILTNQHVVFQAEKIAITIPNLKKTFNAEIIGSDTLTDIALLKIDTNTMLKFPKFGDPDKTKVGEWVIAVGNPFGLDGTVSFGIISAKGRNLQIGLINEFMQTDAMIDPGSSGGPLVNLKGEVIGINSMVQGRGIGFTIPINIALDIKNRFLEEGMIERGWLGITMQPLNRDLATYLKIGEQNGIIVNSVMDDSPASKAGIKPGDIIFRYNNQPIEAETDRDLKNFQRLIGKTEIDKGVKIEIIRNGEKRELYANIKKQPKTESKEIESKFGFNILEITNDIYISNRLETKSGVFVTFVEAGSEASEANLFPGDVIVWIEGKNINTVDDFLKGIEGLKGRESFLIKIMRGRDLRFTLFKTGRRNGGVD